MLHVIKFIKMDNNKKLIETNESVNGALLLLFVSFAIVNYNNTHT